MIDIFRKFAGSTIAKIFLILVAISFVVAGGLGSGNIAQRKVATIGDITISYAEFNGEYNRRLQSLQLQNTPKKELRELDLARNVLNGMVARKLIQLETQDLNLSVSDEFIGNTLKAMKFFQKNDKFDTATFKRTLNSAGYNEEEYITILESDLVEQRYNETMNSITFETPNVANLLARNAEQKRSGLKAEKTLSTITVAKPTEVQLTQYFKSEKESFRVLEMRDTSVLNLSIKSIKNSISDEEANNVFKANSALYQTEESRDYYYFTGEKEILERLVLDVNSGSKLKDAVQKHFKKDAATFLKTDIKRTALPSYSQKAVFETKTSEFSNIEVGAFGTSVVLIKKINPPKIPSFEIVKDEVKTSLADEKLLEYINTVEDSISAGYTLEEVAQNMNIKINTINNVSINGGTSTLSQDKAFTKEIFELSVGDTSLAIELANGGYAIARLNKVKETYIPTLSNIKNDIEKAYVLMQKKILLQEKLNELKSAKSINVFKKIATKNGFEISNVKKISRAEATKNEATAILFENTVNTANGVVVNDTAYSLFTTDIFTPEKASVQTVESLKRTLSEISTSSVHKAIIVTLEKKYPVDININTLNSIYL